MSILGDAVTAETVIGTKLNFCVSLLKVDRYVCIVWHFLKC